VTDGRVDSTIGLDIELRIKDSKVEKFKFTITGDLTVTADYRLEGTVSGRITLERDLTNGTFSQIFLAPIPGLIEIEFLAGIEVEGTQTAIVETGFNFNTPINAGARLLDDVWTPLWGLNPTATIHEPVLQLDSSLDLRLYVKPRITIAFFGVVGPFIHLKAYVGGEIEPGSEPCSLDFDSYLGATAAIGVRTSTLLSVVLPLSSSYSWSPDEDLRVDLPYDFTLPLPPELCVVDNDGDGYTYGSDCDDDDPSVHPGAPELCDGKDNDCDAEIDEGTIGSTWCRDADTDGFGNPNNTRQACDRPAGYAADCSDCDDADASVHPGASELCDDEADNDCDHAVDCDDADCADECIDPPEFISPPVVSGPDTGQEVAEACFVATGASSNLGHPIDLQFQWGDGTTSPWGNAAQCHTWEVAGTYEIRARARCEVHTDVVSDWSPPHEFYVEADEETISTPTITGPATGDTYVQYSFPAQATSSKGHPLFYKFSVRYNGGSWNDDTYEDLDTYVSAFADPGVWDIRVIARCSFGHAESPDWSEPHTIVIEGGSEVTLYSSADAHVRECEPGRNFGDYDMMSTGYGYTGNCGSCSRSRCFVRFDLPPEIAGSTIAQATLAMYTDAYGHCGGAASITLGTYRANGSWSEAGLTWSNQPAVAGSASDSVTIPYGAADPYSWDVTTIVQAWASGSANNGMVIKPVNEGGNTVYRAFYTKEAGPQWVELEILFEP
jgi:hypothetical protein